MTIKTSIDEMQKIFAKVGKDRGIDMPKVVASNSWLDDIDHKEALEFAEEANRKIRSKKLITTLIIGSVVLLLTVKLVQTGMVIFKDTNILGNLEYTLQDSLEPTIAETVAQQSDNAGGGLLGGVKKDNEEEANSARTADRLFGGVRKKRAGENKEQLALIEAGNTPLDEKNEAENEVSTILNENNKDKARQISAREQQLQVKAAMVNVASDKLGKKQAALDATRDEVKGLLEQYQGEKFEEKGRLVGIFSSMDPKKAALIFNDLDTDIIVEVVRQMTPRKSAQIISAMLPAKAKEVTEVLSGRTLNDERE